MTLSPDRRPYCWFFSVIEISTTVLIVYLAIRWPKPAAAVSP
jgi:hypothetical protein